MSFSLKVKEELFDHLPKSRHCQIAELGGLVLYGFEKSDNVSSSDLVWKKIFTLLNKTLNIDKDVAGITGTSSDEILSLVRVDEDLSTIDRVLLQQPCCKRAFIRGAFMAAGSISDPEKSYHFEVVCNNRPAAEQLLDVMNFFDVEPKIVSRKDKYVVYLKEGSQIVEILRVMEAPVSVMELENVRIVKEMRGSINRRVNCETANIGKTVNAAVRQLEDIKLLEMTVGLENLPENLQQIAYVRLENPDTPLKELGQLLDPPLGKSGVNHRLQKLSELAAQQR